MGKRLENVHRIAVAWTAPVNLDLHVFEYASGFDGEGHVWEQRPRAFSDVRRSGGAKRPPSAGGGGGGGVGGAKDKAALAAANNVSIIHKLFLQTSFLCIFLLLLKYWDFFR